MSGKEKGAVIEKIYDAFSRNVFPGETFLQGSFEGCEPYEEVGPFRDKKIGKALILIFWTPTQGHFAFSLKPALGSFFPHI